MTGNEASPPFDPDRYKTTTREQWQSAADAGSAAYRSFSGACRSRSVGRAGPASGDGAGAGGASAVDRGSLTGDCSAIAVSFLGVSRVSVGNRQRQPQNPYRERWQEARPVRLPHRGAIATMRRGGARPSSTRAR